MGVTFPGCAVGVHVGICDWKHLVEDDTNSKNEAQQAESQDLGGVAVTQGGSCKGQAEVMDCSID